MKTLIAVPCMDTVQTRFFVSYSQMTKVGETALAALQSSLIYDARNRLAQAALDAGADRILWLDSDMALPQDLMERLSEDLDGGCEYVSALIFRRVPPHSPVLFDTVDRREEGGKLHIDAAGMTGWPVDRVFEIAGSGLGACMMTVDLLRRVQEKYGLPFSPLIGFGEDLAFCWRARQLGARLYCDSRVKPLHIGTAAYGESDYLDRGREHNDSDRYGRTGDHR